MAQDVSGGGENPVGSGYFQLVDLPDMNYPARFYKVHSP